jgi:uncharacterized lipoprotein YbaY
MARSEAARVRALVLIAVVAAACASVQGPDRVSGSVTYRERSALPPGAVVRVTLADVSLVGVPERVIAEQEIRPTTQVPIPFTLVFDPKQIDRERRYGVRATITDAEGRMHWSTTQAEPVLTQGGASEGVVILLRQVGRLEPEGRGSVWEVARRRGVDFRATGNEPGWWLEIAEGERIAFATDYGATRVVAPAPPPRVEAAAARTTYHAVAEAHDLAVVIEARPCRDDMSGEAFEAAVTVTLDGRVHRGCGRALR